MKIDKIAIGDISHNASVILDISGTDATRLPIGTTSQRPISSNLATRTKLDIILH